MNDQGLEPFVPRLLRVGDQIKIGEAVFTFAVYDGTARLFGQVSYTDNEPVVLPTSFASKTSAQPSLAPLELPTYEPAPHVQKQPRKYGKVKGRWISILIVVGLIATSF